MLIIGLTGSTRKRRENVAQALAVSGLAPLGVYALRVPVEGPGRVSYLRQVVGDFQGYVDDSSGLVLSHLLTAEEADWVREKNGMIMHVQGVPSGSIPIMREDLLVTPESSGVRQYLGPIEALSEMLLRHQWWMR